MGICTEPAELLDAPAGQGAPGAEKARGGALLERERSGLSDLEVTPKGVEKEE